MHCYDVLQDPLAQPELRVQMCSGLQPAKRGQFATHEALVIRRTSNHTCTCESCEYQKVQEDLLGCILCFHSQTCKRIPRLHHGHNWPRSWPHCHVETAHHVLNVLRDFCSRLRSLLLIITWSVSPGVHPKQRRLFIVWFHTTPLHHLHSS